jgi:hypothetical protein
MSVYSHEEIRKIFRRLQIQDINSYLLSKIIC